MLVILLMTASAFFFFVFHSITAAAICLSICLFIDLMALIAFSSKDDFAGIRITSITAAIEIIGLIFLFFVAST